MNNVCIFAGTTEGRRLIDFLETQPIRITACVATEYGEELLPSSPLLTVSMGRLSQDDMETMFRSEHFDCVIDATHPYADEATENIMNACKMSGAEYLRLLRPVSSESYDGAVSVPDIDAVVEYLRETDGNILLTTGSKTLSAFSALENFSDRVYARVLPTEEALQTCKDAGLRTSHILAMQGPFSAEMNTAMLRAVSARYLVTKEAGSEGGFAEKMKAALDMGVIPIIIGRPQQREGMTFEEIVELLCSRFGLVRKPRVSVVGIGPGSPEKMTKEVQRTIHEADCVIGAARMLEFAKTLNRHCFCAISPQEIADYIENNAQFHSFAVALSGDTGFFSGAKKLLPLLEKYSVRVLPGLSSLSCLCAQLGVSYEDVTVISMHGRSADIVPDVLRNRRVFVLTGGDEEQNVCGLCRRLTDAGLGDVRISVGERLGYPDEKLIHGTADSLSKGQFDPLSVMLIENDRPYVVTPGIPDGEFLRGNRSDGKPVPMTKSEVRAVCLSKLRLTDQAVCWDVGAGTGSTAVEMAQLVRPHGHVYAVEKDPEAAALIEENRKKFYLQNLNVVSGTAPEACRTLPVPTHVFIGGSAGNLREIIQTAIYKNPEVRIVATAVTLEGISELTACMREFPFVWTETVMLTVSRDRKVSDYHLLSGQNPISIFSFQAGGESI